MLLVTHEMAATLAVFGMLVFTGLILAVVIPMQLRQEKARIAEWRTWARENQFRFEEPGGSWIRRTPSRIVGEAKGLAFVYDRQVVSTGKSHIVFTRLVVQGPTIVPGKLVVLKNHIFNRVGAAFRGKRVETGDARFDRALLVAYKAADASSATLNERTRELLLSLPRFSDLTIQKGVLTLRWIGSSKNSTTLDQGLAVGLAPWLASHAAAR